MNCHSLTIYASTSKQPEKHEVNEPELKKILIPLEIIYVIFSIFDCKELANVSLVSKVTHLVATDIRFPCYQWILQSDLVRQLEAKKLPSLTCLEELSPTLLLQTYGFKNHFHHFLSSISLNDLREIPLSTIDINSLLLAVRQGSLPAMKIAEKLFGSLKKKWFGQNLLLLLKELADAGSEKAIEKLLRGRLKGTFKLNETCTEQKTLELVEEYVKKGSDIALCILASTYVDGWEGLASIPLEVQEKHKRLIRALAHSSIPYQGEGFQEIKKLADKGHQDAIRTLLLTYMSKTFGNDSKTMAEGLQLATSYAEKGSANAVEILLYAYNSGEYGLEENEAKNDEGLRLAHLYAEKGFIVAIDYLIQGYQFGFWGINKQDEKTQLKLEQLAKKYAPQGIESAIRALLVTYRIKIRKKGFDALEKEELKFAQESADRGYEAAIKFLLDYSKDMGVANLAEHYTNLGSQIALLRFLKQHYKENNDSQLLELLRHYLNIGAPSAVKFLVDKCIIGD